MNFIRWNFFTYQLLCFRLIKTSKLFCRKEDHQDEMLVRNRNSLTNFEGIFLLLDWCYENDAFLTMVDYFSIVGGKSNNLLIWRPVSEYAEQYVPFLRPPSEYDYVLVQWVELNSLWVGFNRNSIDIRVFVRKGYCLGLSRNSTAHFIPHSVEENIKGIKVFDWLYVNASYGIRARPKLTSQPMQFSINVYSSQLPMAEHVNFLQAADVLPEIETISSDIEPQHYRLFIFDDTCALADGTVIKVRTFAGALKHDSGAQSVDIWRPVDGSAGKYRLVFSHVEQKRHYGLLTTNTDFRILKGDCLGSRGEQGKSINYAVHTRVKADEGLWYPQVTYIAFPDMNLNNTGLDTEVDESLSERKFTKMAISLEIRYDNLCQLYSQDSVSCDLHASCVASNECFTCACDEGYTGDGVTCHELVESVNTTITSSTDTSTTASSTSTPSTTASSTSTPRTSMPSTSALRTSTSSTSTSSASEPSTGMPSTTTSSTSAPSTTSTAMSKVTSVAETTTIEGDSLTTKPTVNGDKKSFQPTSRSKVATVSTSGSIMPIVRDVLISGGMMLTVGLVGYAASSIISLNKLQTDVAKEEKGLDIDGDLDNLGGGKSSSSESSNEEEDSVSRSNVTFLSE